jgi:protein TonB
MFDGIGVNEATGKPWTVPVSMAAQTVMIGLAILVPLVTTEALPHGHLISLLSLPEPPRAAPARTPRVAVKPPSAARAIINLDVLQAPLRIPEKAAMLIDPPSLPQPASPGINGSPVMMMMICGGANPIHTPCGATRGSGSLLDDPPKLAPAKPNEPTKAIPRIPVGGQVQAAKLISGPPPLYPVLAQQARISGVVLLDAVISRDGRIMDLRATSGHPLLIPAALAAVKQWVFRPTYLNGDPVEVATGIEVAFKLQQ